MNSALTSHELAILTAEFAKIPAIESVILFGSRALGTHEKGSDVDLCVKGSRLQDEDVLHLHDVLNEEIPLPYFFDIVDYKSISNDELRQHIDTHGKCMYSICNTSKDKNMAKAFA